jgi:hypothetical protein
MTRSRHFRSGKTSTPDGDRCLASDPFASRGLRPPGSSTRCSREVASPCRLSSWRASGPRSTESWTPSTIASPIQSGLQRVSVYEGVPCEPRRSSPVANVGTRPGAPCPISCHCMTGAKPDHGWALLCGIKRRNCVTRRRFIVGQLGPGRVAILHGRRSLGRVPISHGQLGLGRVPMNGRAPAALKTG